jgi:hypothetical protein
MLSNGRKSVAKAEGESGGLRSNNKSLELGWGSVCSQAGDIAGTIVVAHALWRINTTSP